MKTDRPIPAHWSREADMLVKSLLTDEVIKRVTHSTEWCFLFWLKTEMDNGGKCSLNFAVLQ